MKLNVLLFIFCCATSSLVYPSYTEQAYATVLGSEDISPEYATILRQALRSFHVPNADSVPLKKMNSLVPTLLGADIYSFTALGIWINEALLNQCSQAERVFACYHEAAHYARQDHYKTIVHTIPYALVCAGILHVSKKMASTTYALATGLALTITSGYMYNNLVIRPCVVDQEQGADTQAAAVLRASGQEALVHEYLKQLHDLALHGHHEHTDGWHPTIQEQITYLKDIA